MLSGHERRLMRRAKERNSLRDRTGSPGTTLVGASF